MSTLKELEPTGSPRVRDLVREAGVDVRDWSNFSRGAKWAAANPKYCYEWSFVEPGRVVVLNLWYSDMKEVAGVIAFHHNARNWEHEFSKIPGRSAWAARARKMDAAIQEAFRSNLPVRLILLAGERRGESLPTDQVSRVKKRRLDDEVWAVTTYDSVTGACIISRGATVVSLPGEAADDNTTNFTPQVSDRREVVERQIRERRGQQSFRNSLRRRYGDRCMITGCELLSVIEAAHISPYRGEEDNHEANGLLLRSDIHTLFDLNLLGIDPEGLSVALHPSAVGAYGELADVTLKCGKNGPSTEALKIRFIEFCRGVRGGRLTSARAGGTDNA
jgi:hypothetical protein